MGTNTLLILGGFLSLLAALLHVYIIIEGGLVQVKSLRQWMRRALGIQQC